MTAKVEQSLFAIGKIGRGVVQCDLLRLRPLDTEHANDLTMSGHAVCAQVICRADQEDVFLLPARQGSLGN